jgi:NDP-sugar pyrophosphorylase family protein
LLFDSEAKLCGRRAGQDGKPELVRTASQFQALAFSGIHVISSHLLPRLSEDGAFSIITSYLRLAAAGERICAFRADEYSWRDMGRLENIAKAAEELKTINSKGINHKGH